MNATIARLAHAARGTRSLSRWYADPLDRTQARRLFARAHQSLQKAHIRGRGSIIARIQIMIAHHWLGDTIERDYRNLFSPSASTRRGRALVELVYGQLLMSHKITGAIEHLDKGFELAANLFDPCDYFVVRKRHDTLRRLYVGVTPGPPQTLRQLLVEAAVIQRLESSAGDKPIHGQNPGDMLG